MRNPSPPSARHRRWLPYLLGAATVGLAWAFWFGFTQYQCRRAREYLSTFSQATTPVSLPGNDALRSQVTAFGRPDWQHLIQEAARGETSFERWLNDQGTRLPAGLIRLLPKPGNHRDRLNALTKAWLLSWEDLDHRRMLLLRAIPGASPTSQPLLAELCFTHQRSATPVLTRPFLEEIQDAGVQAPNLRLLMMPPLSWSAEPGIEPQVRALLIDWIRDPDPQVAEGAARTLARRPP